MDTELAGRPSTTSGVDSRGVDSTGPKSFHTRSRITFAGRTHDFVDGDIVEIPKAPWGPFLFVVCMYYGFQWTEGDVSLGFLRSLAKCPIPLPKVPGSPLSGAYPSGRFCPDGAYYEGPWDPSNFTTPAPTPEPTGELLADADAAAAAEEFVWPTSTVDRGDLATQQYQAPGTVIEGECKAIPREHIGWSMSPDCMDQNYVVLGAYKVIGSIVSFSTGGAMLATLFFGATCIDSWGRKPMLLISFLAQILNAVCLVVVDVANLDLESLTTFVFLSAGALFASCLNTFQAAAGAMVVDGTPPDSNERSTRLVIFTVIRGLATIFNVGTTYIVLRWKLESYTMVWPIYGVLLCCQLGLSSILLIETKPVVPDSGMAKPPGYIEVACREIRAMAEICTSDRRLHTGIWCAGVSGALFAVSTSMAPNWIVLVLKLDSATASLGGAYGSLFALVGSACSGPICIKYSQLKCLYMSQVCTILGFATIPVGVILPGGWEIVSFWVGVGPFLSFGTGLAAPALFALLSSRVAPESQGKFFSGLGLCGLGMTTILLFIWTQYLVFPESPTPIRDMTRGWIIGAVGQCCIIFVTYLAFGCNYIQVTVAGSQVQFVEGPSGSRVLAATEYTNKEGVVVTDGGLHF